jgi:hypothetical protein
MEEIDQPQFTYKEKRSLFLAIAISVMRSGGTFTFENFLSLARLHSLGDEFVTRAYRGWIRQQLERKRIRQIESCDASIATYELI